MDLNLNSIYMMFDYLNIRNTFYEIHSVRTANLCYHICAELELDLETTKLIFYSAMVHDIGQIALSEELIEKTEELLSSELAIIKTHVLKTISILKSLDVSDDIIEIVKYHHERLDGSGYPYGAKTIPFGSKVLMVADVAEAMLSDRPYRKKRSLDYINNILLTGNCFEPTISKTALYIISSNPNWDKLPENILCIF